MKTNVEFCKLWQKGVVDMLVKTHIRRAVKEGEVQETKVSAMRTLTAKISEGFFKHKNTPMAIANRASVVLGFKAAGRTQEGQYCMSSDISWNIENENADITCRHFRYLYSN